MTEKNDALGLSLSLSLSIPAANQQNSQKPAPFPVNPYKPFLKQSECSRTDAFQLLSADRNVESRSLVPGTNMNQGVVVIDCEAEGIVSSPNSTVSSVSGKRSAERDENDGYRAVSSSLEADDDAAARKKLRLSKEQATVLEATFKEHHTLDQRRKVELGKQLNLTPRQVEVWFQNRRARTKLKQTEVDCEYLKRRCKNLTEENKRLQKEVNELRTLKLSPECYMKMSPPTTLTMCSQCERVMSSTKTSSTSCQAATKEQPMTTALLL